MSVLTIPSTPAGSVGAARADAQRLVALGRVLRRLHRRHYPIAGHCRHLAPLLTDRTAPPGYVGLHRASSEQRVVL